MVVVNITGTALFYHFRRLIYHLHGEFTREVVKSEGGEVPVVFGEKYIRYEDVLGAEEVVVR